MASHVGKLRNQRLPVRRLRGGKCSGSEQTAYMGPPAGGKCGQIAVHDPRVARRLCERRVQMSHARSVNAANCILPASRFLAVYQTITAPHKTRLLHPHPECCPPLSVPPLRALYAHRRLVRLLVFAPVSSSIQPLPASRSSIRVRAPRSTDNAFFNSTGVMFTAQRIEQSVLNCEAVISIGDR